MTVLAVILYFAFLWFVLTVAIIIVVSLVKYRREERRRLRRRGPNGERPAPRRYDPTGYHLHPPMPLPSFPEEGGGAVAGPGHVVDVPVSASEPNPPKAGSST